MGFGLLEVIAPDRVIEFGERLAFEAPDRGGLRPWTVPIARLEGLAFVWLLHRDDGLPAGLETGIVIGGCLMALLPRTVVDWGLGAAYENPDDLELKGWVIPATRLLGAVYLLAVLFSRPVDAPRDAAGDYPEPTE
ncbi:hypothetical protein CP556_07320 [Natrinema sp. CBA1119]|uniref:hypothetical protein n=1 Tax=Natrinema sp. CBA1119 TaxID=1608465 RepID=UPI000BF5B883|nr:hypothetical protein [Natrinema sp. CBA1119]PGF15946.1 hypothetical protein CP556_07320 [Natrinema sp. CBA1119]